MPKWRILKMGGATAPGDAFDYLRDIAEIVAVPSTREKIYEAIPDFDVVFALLNVRFDREMLDRAKRLRVITTPATGRDHVDLDVAEEKGIVVLSLKDETEFLSNVTATAEMTWALLLAVARKLPWAFEATKQGRWRGGGIHGRQISGKTLGIVGYGRLGRITAQYGHGFRMNVLATDVRPVIPDQFVTMVDMDTLLRESDVVSLHIHMTPENRHIINREAFAKMKQDAILLNTSRGGLIDEEAFIEALSSGKLLGAGIDVIDGEWDPNIADHPLIRYAREHDNLVISPHIGGSTVESGQMTQRFTIKRLKEYLLTLK